MLTVAATMKAYSGEVCVVQLMKVKLGFRNRWNKTDPQNNFKDDTFAIFFFFFFVI